MKMRADEGILGPRTQVTVTNAQRSTLEKPEEFFVELSVFQRDNPGRTVKPEELVWEQMNGKWVQGVFRRAVGMISFV